MQNKSLIFSALIGVLSSCSSGHRRPAGEFDSPHNASASSSKEAPAQLTLEIEKSVKLNLGKNKKAIEALLIKGTPNGKCAGQYFVLSAKELPFSNAVEFCKELNEILKPETKEWKLADIERAGTLRERCEFEDVVGRTPQLNQIFLGESQKRQMNVWNYYPPGRTIRYPHPVGTYPLKKTPGAPDMEYGRPVNPQTLPVLCAL